MSRINSLRRQPLIFLINLDYLNGLTLASVGLSVKPSSKSGRDEHIIVSSVSCVCACILSRYVQEVHMIQLRFHLSTS